MRPSTTRFLMGLSAVLMATALTLTVSLIVQSENAAHPNPSPARGAMGPTDPDSDFPAVDWVYWQKTNPDVIGWVTVPNTGIDLPICQGPNNNPTYYLNHDVYGNWNIYGCPYLDAACSEQGLNSPLAMVFAHHMDDGTMFSALASYSDESFRKDHPEILLQMPGKRTRLSVAAVDVVNANQEFKDLEFASDDEFMAWWGEAFEGCDFKVIPDAGKPQSVKAFVTCSYETWNSRTIVYAIEESRDADNPGFETTEH